MWNLDDIYTGFNETYLSDLEDLKSLMALYQHHVLNVSRDNIVSYIEDYLTLEETITKRVRSLYAYASLRYSSNVNDSEPLTYMSKLDTILKSITKEEVMLSRLIQTLDIDDLSSKSELIQTYQFHLERIKTSASYLLSESEEILLAKMRELASDSWRRLQNMLTANLKVSYLDQTLTLPEVRNLAYEKDPMTRFEGYKAELKALETIEDPVALSITNIKREVNTINELRGYKSPLEPTLQSSKKIGRAHV
jgi:oligoendopeptidase F